MNVDVAGNLTIHPQSGFSQQDAVNIAQTLNTLRENQKLSIVQFQQFVEAANIMMGAVMKQLASMNHQLSYFATEATQNQILSIVTQISSQQKANPNIDLVAQAKNWEEKYELLLKQWIQLEGSSDLDQEAKQAFAELDLDRAGKILDGLLEDKIAKKIIQVQADRHYQRANVFELQDNPLHAIGHYKRAYELVCHIPKYAFSYAGILQQQNCFTEAIPIYEKALQGYRILAKENPIVYLPNVAIVLNDMGLLYFKTQEFHKAKEFYNESMDICRILVEENPVNALSCLGDNLSAMGDLYCETQVFEQAERFYSMALEAYKKMAKYIPEIYLPLVAMTLNNLGILFCRIWEWEKAKAVFREALETYHVLDKENFSSYRSDVVTTLSNLGKLYCNIGLWKKAEVIYNDALEIQRSLYQICPATHSYSLCELLHVFSKILEKQNRREELDKINFELLSIQ